MMGSTTRSASWSRSDPSLAEAALCAGCHQFGFAVRDAHGASARLSTASAQQDTVAEWRAWSAATHDERTCTTCHMETHAFGGAGRTDALRAALTVTQRDGALEVTTSDVGHPFPTGDIMRWLTLELSATPFFEAPVVAAAQAHRGRARPAAVGLRRHHAAGLERQGHASSASWR
jgi:hypothetical protein